MNSCIRWHFRWWVYFVESYKRWLLKIWTVLVFGEMCVESQGTRLACLVPDQIFTVFIFANADEVAKYLKINPLWKFQRMWPTYSNCLVHFKTVDSMQNEKFFIYMYVGTKTILRTTVSPGSMTQHCDLKWHHMTSSLLRVTKRVRITWCHSNCLH